ncbi:hypothetical protein [Enhygromyxa salina]|nr:hypothetical protein [Enhygromyxa salina]
MTDWERSLWEAMVSAFEDGKSATLYELCQGFLSRQPGNVPALALMLHSLSSMFRFDECEQLIRDNGPIWEEANDRRVWYRAMGAYLTRCGRHAEAEQALREGSILYVHPPGDLVLDIVESMISQGKLCSALQEIDEILADVEQADLREDEQHELLERRAFVLRNLGHLREALLAIDQLQNLAAEPSRLEELRMDIADACQAQVQLTKFS